MAAADAGVGSGALDQYEVLGTIGQGSFGTVQKVKRKADGRVSFIGVSLVTPVGINMPPAAAPGLQVDELREHGGEREATCCVRGALTGLLHTYQRSNGWLRHR